METNEIKKLAAKANGETWKYLAKETLGVDERLQVLACAYGSLYLWKEAGGGCLHFARAHWLISRVATVLGEVSLAEQHAQTCKAYTAMAEDRKDFDEVYAIEAEARVAAMKKETSKAKSLKEKAIAMAAQVKDDGDRKITEGDMQSPPWFGV